MELNESREQLKQQGLGLAAISYDSIAVLDSFARRKQIGFTLLSDPDSKVIREFGVFNEDVPKDNPFYGIPHPITFLVDAKGKVVSKEAEKDFRERPTVSSLMVEKFGLRTGAAQSEIQSKYAHITASSSNSVIRAGEHIRLILDIQLPPGMHVYAPGVEGYLPIEWKMRDAISYSAMAVEYPKAKILRLEAIQETVPVYEGQFTLQREVTLSNAQKLTPTLTPGQEIVVEGTLRYQACDDRQCYLPQTVPLQWKLRYEPHDTQRAPEELRKKVR